MEQRPQRRAPLNTALLVSFVTFVSLAGAASEASAELVFFASGASLNVKAHRAEGDSLVLTLRSGGEVVCPASSIVRIEPDEVPYPEPVAAAIVQDGLDAAGSLPADTARRVLRADPRYDPIIERVAKEQGVDARLVRAVIQVESAYQPRAISPKGAVGLMQVMPATARQYGVRNPFNPASNIEAGIKHLRSLLQRLPLPLALAAYNAGEAAVERFSGMPPYPETRNYVTSILRLVNP